MIEVVHACVPVPVHLPVMIEVERLDGIRELRKGLDL